MMIIILAIYGQLLKLALSSFQLIRCILITIINSKRQFRAIMSRISHHDYRCQYSFQEHISQGAFGRVSRVVHRQTKTTYALKRIEVKSPEQLKQSMQEVSMLEKIKQMKMRSQDKQKNSDIWDQVIQMHGYYVVQVKNSYSKASHQVGILFQLAQHSLQQLIKCNKKGSQSPKPRSIQKYLQQQNWLQFCISLVKLLKYFQNIGIAHRDIKPANILAFSDEVTGKPTWKLADFGFAVHVCPQKNTVLSSQIANIAGSYEYASPKLRQILKFPSMNTNSKQKLNYFKNDVYSLGITMLEIITGSTQINECTLKALFGSSVDQKLAQIVQIMLERDEEKRPCFNKLYQFVKKICRQHFESDQNIREANVCASDSDDKLSRLQTQCTQFQVSSKLDSCQESPELTKTVRKFNKQQIQTKSSNPSTTYQILIGHPITAVVILSQSLIMCGCEDGNLVLIVINDYTNNNKHGLNDKKNINMADMTQIVRVAGVHNGAITQIVHNKEQDKIWTAGYDGQVIGWDLQLLRLLINSRINEGRLQNNKKFGIQCKQLQGILNKLTIQAPPNNQQSRPSSNQSNCNKISSMYVVDDNNFAIAYFSGHTYIRWQQKSAYIQLHRRPITALVAIDQILYSASMDGTIRSINLAELQPNTMIFVHRSSIMSMHLDSINQQLVCLTQGRQVIRVGLQGMRELQATQLPSSGMYLSSAMYSSTQALYTATQDGILYAINSNNNNNNKKGKYVRQIYRSNKSSGINCIATKNYDGTNCVITGGYDGRLTVLGVDIANTNIF